MTIVVLFPELMELLFTVSAIRQTVGEDHLEVSVEKGPVRFDLTEANK